jgi:hypothetical protein
MPLLNYTTEIDVERTVGEISKLLSMHGAQSIMTDYDEGYVKSLSFLIVVNGKRIGVRLPTDWKPVLAILEEQRVPKKLQTRDQAVRVAWRIIKVWVEAQMAIIDTKMVKIQEVFLPYVVTNNGLTLAEKFEEDDTLLLGDGN